MKDLKVGDEVIMIGSDLFFYSKGDTGVIVEHYKGYELDTMEYRVKFTDSIKGMWVYNNDIELLQPLTSPKKSYLWRFFHTGIEQ